jgi:hypothetical protein
MPRDSVNFAKGAGRGTCNPAVAVSAAADPAKGKRRPSFIKHLLSTLPSGLRGSKREGATGFAGFADFEGNSIEKVTGFASDAQRAALRRRSTVAQFGRGMGNEG